MEEQVRATVSSESRDRVATKSDDAEVPVFLWTEQFINTSEGRYSLKDAPRIEWAMDVLRHRMFILVWRRRVFRSFANWVKASQGVSSVASTDVEDHFVKEVWDSKGLEYEWVGPTSRAEYAVWHRTYTRTLKRDFEAAADAIGRATGSSWWDWDAGSTPFHWRWPKYYQTTIRDGLPIYMAKQAPIYRVPQKDTKDPDLKELLIRKLRKVRERGYISRRDIISLTTFFGVKKGAQDRRVVYNGTESGLNDAVWVPSFWLPTPRTHFRQVTEETQMGDLDVGEMFLNFPLHPDMVPYCGVDLSLYFPDEIPPGEDHLWEAWTRTGMGFKWSPYQAVQGMTVADEVISGDRSDPTNVFRWSHVRLNLPGSPEYRPDLPWVSKVREEDGKVAADKVVFVDDARTSGNGQKEAWQATRRVGSKLTYLGLQDASRKRRRVSSTPGAWAGCVVWTSREQGVFSLVSNEKWDKTKALVAELDEMIQLQQEALDRKRLEEIRGFLVHIGGAYRGINPYLNGLHLTIDGWRPNRDTDGWRMRNYAGTTLCQGASFEKATVGTLAYRGPDKVKAMPRLRSDVRALQQLVGPERPPLKRVRCSRSATVLYGFGDASGTGFATTLQRAGSSEIEVEFGQWPSTVASEMSSNWKELNNFVELLERKGREGRLNDLELFLATDNMVTERAFFKGYSGFPVLDALVLRLRVLELTYHFLLHITHVSGRRMIQQGTDGASRGDQGTGSMTGIPIREFLPLHLDAFSRWEPLKGWIREICSGLAPLTFLDPDGWFTKAHSPGNFVWVPPPAAAEVVVEQLSMARIKRPECFHMVVVPRLFTAYWRKHLTRATDLCIPFQHDKIWPIDKMFEPLLIFVCLPLISYRPRFALRAKLLDELQRLLLSPGLPQAHQSWFRGRLRQLLSSSRELLTL